MSSDFLAQVSFYRIFHKVSPPKVNDIAISGGGLAGVVEF